MNEYNQRIASLLGKMANNNSLAHAFLLVGADINKMEIVDQFTKWIQGNHKKSFTSFMEEKCACDVCNSIDKGLHPDVHKITGDMEVEKAREIVRSASYSPFVGPHTIYIIERADKLRRESANALLKYLEEPINTIFFLTAPTESSVLPTIASRCLVVRCSGTGNKNMDFSGNPYKEYGEKFMRGGIKERIEIAEKMHKLSKDGAFTKEDLMSMLEIWSHMYIRDDNTEAARIIQNVRRSINSNANIQTALTYVALSV